MIEFVTAVGHQMGRSGKASCLGGAYLAGNKLYGKKIHLPLPQTLLAVQHLHSSG